MKNCKNCKELKSYDLFYFNNSYYSSECKQCHRIRTKIRENKKLNSKNEKINYIDGEFFKPYNKDLLVSNYGRVFKKECENGNKRYSHFLKQTLMKNGYLTISYNKKKLYIHRLVAECFCKNLKRYEFVNHIDFNKKNNNSLNLEWCTNEYNTNHAVINDRFSVKLNREQVLKIRELGVNKSVKDLSLRYGVSSTNIALILNRKIWKHI